MVILNIIRSIYLLFHISLLVSLYDLGYNPKVSHGLKVLMGPQPPCLPCFLPLCQFTFTATLDSFNFPIGWTPGVGDEQGGLACCDSWGRKESDTTEPLNWTELNICSFLRASWHLPPSAFASLTSIQHSGFSLSVLSLTHIRFPQTWSRKWPHLSSIITMTNSFIALMVRYG